MTRSNRLISANETIGSVPAAERGLPAQIAARMGRSILRGELLDQGKAHEAVLTLADLAAAKQLYVGNSLRGLIAARLVY